MKAMVATLALLALLAPLSIAQTTLRVPSQYRTIQLGINAASPSDTVLVAPGTYKEWGVDFKGKAITVRSSGGASVTTIDAGANGPVVQFVTTEGRDSVLEGFTLTNGGSAGVRCVGSSPTIRDNLITGNAASKGGAIFCTSSSALIERNTISSNTSGWGGGIYCDQGSPVIIQNTITNNTGAGITCDNGATPLISRNTISFNNSGSNGGGGILCYIGSSPIIVNNMIHRNIGAHGGGINCSGANAVITGNTLTNNSSNGYGGDGIHVHGAVTVTITNCIVWETGPTGAIQVWSGNVTVTHCNVAGGYTGVGNISVDPQFVDPMNGDLHLDPGSPCVNQGTNGAPQMPSEDFDGQSRITGGVTDIGADEVGNDTLYLIGTPTPGNSISLIVLGKPGNHLVLLATSFEPNVLNPPVTVPGYGDFYLNWPYAIIPLGAIPPSGRITFPVTFPPTFPTPRTFPVQALIGNSFSNHLVVKVR